MKYEGNIRIKPTDGSDLPALLRLWNSGEVMRLFELTAADWLRAKNTP